MKYLAILLLLSVPLAHALEPSSHAGDFTVTDDNGQIHEMWADLIADPTVCQYEKCIVLVYVTPSGENEIIEVADLLLEGDPNLGGLTPDDHLMQSSRDLFNAAIRNRFAFPRDPAYHPVDPDLYLRLAGELCWDPVENIFKPPAP